MYFDYSFSESRMDEDGVLEEYEKYHVSEEQERAWRNQAAENLIKVIDKNQAISLYDFNNKAFFMSVDQKKKLLYALSKNTAVDDRSYLSMLAYLCIKIEEFEHDHSERLRIYNLANDMFKSRSYTDDDRKYIEQIVKPAFERLKNEPKK